MFLFVFLGDRGRGAWDRVGNLAPPVCRLACPGDSPPWRLCLVGEADPVHHRTPQTCHEGDCGEPLPVSRAGVGWGASSSRWDHTVPWGRCLEVWEGPGPATLPCTSSAGAAGGPGLVACPLQAAMAAPCDHSSQSTGQAVGINRPEGRK